MLPTFRPAEGRQRSRRSLTSVMRYAVVIGSLTMACGDDTLTAPADTVISLVASSPAVALGGSIELTANLVKPNGAPVDDGTPVTFACCSGASSPQPSGAPGTAAQAGSSSLGTMDPPVALTSGGRAVARFNASTRSGVATIAAISGGARVGTIQIAVGGAAASQLVLSASPSIISSAAGGTDIIATVMDGAGNGVSGIDVSFSTTAGTLASPSATTGAGGIATMRLTTNRDATVTATAGTKTANTTVKVAPSPTLSVAVTPQSPLAGQVAQFAFTATPAVGGAPLRDLSINFGNGTTTTINGLSGVTSVSQVYANPGTYTIVSTLTDAGGEKAVATTIITVLPRPPLTISVDVTGGTNPFAGIPIVFTAVVGPASELSRVSRIEWDFGDGSTAITNGFSTAHVFTTATTVVTRVISATVVTFDGARFTGQTTIVVRPVP